MTFYLHAVFLDIVRLRNAGEHGVAASWWWQRFGAGHPTNQQRQHHVLLSGSWRLTTVRRAAMAGCCFQPSTYWQQDLHSSLRLVQYYTQSLLTVNISNKFLSLSFLNLNLSVASDLNAFQNMQCKNMLGPTANATNCINSGSEKLRKEIGSTWFINRHWMSRTWSVNAVDM